MTSICFSFSLKVYVFVYALEQNYIERIRCSHFAFKHSHITRLLVKLYFSPLARARHTIYLEAAIIKHAFLKTYVRKRKLI